MTQQDSNVHSPAHRLHFGLAEVFPPDDPLSVPLIRLMMAANDVRHIQKLLFSTGERIEHANDFERVVLNGEMLHFHRLLCGHLYEGGNAFRNIDTPHPELANAAVRGTENEESLKRLREAYAGDPPGAFHHSFLKAVRNQFGFHYKEDKIQAKLQNFVSSGDLDGEVIAAELGGLSRYVIADHLSIGMLQDILKSELPGLHAAFETVMGKAIELAGDLGIIVDSMLLPLLEQNEAAIIKHEQGTLSVQQELLIAKQQVDEQQASSDSPENAARKENGT